MTVSILGVRGNQIRMGIEAPPEVKVHREEIFKKIQAERKTSVQNNRNTTILKDRKSPVLKSRETLVLKNKKKLVGL